jgi:hypothetical protein
LSSPLNRTKKGKLLPMFAGFRQHRRAAFVLLK